MKKLLLHEIVNFRFGVNAKANKFGAIPLIQGNSINNIGIRGTEGVPRTDFYNIKDRDYLKRNEILFSSKGYRNHAVVWKGEIENAVASSTFLVLAIKTKAIAPEYLAWYLNSPLAKEYFQKYQKEGTIPNINKKAIASLEVSVPTNEEQQKIVKLYELRRKETEICELINLKKEKMYNSLTSKFLKGEIKWRK